MVEYTRSNLLIGASVPEPSPERRQYVRVMDAVGLEFRSRSANSCDDGAGSRSGQVAMANRYDLDGYATVKRDYPEVTDYIDILEKWIRQLQLGGNLSLEAPTHKIILSATGIAFAENRLQQQVMWCR